MNEYILFRNFKRWLFIYGQPLLDLLLPIKNSEATKPIDRYENLPENFNKHFNLLAYYSSQLQPDLPVVLLSFEDLSNNDCFLTYRVTFDVYFQTISPNDCKDDRIVICNSPEEILRFKQLIQEALCILMYNTDKDMRKQIFNGKLWEYPINYTVVEESYGDLTGIMGDEVLHFQTSYEITDNETTC